MVFDINNKEAFDEAAELVFASIPAEEKQAHAGQLVVINPNADASIEKQYVFGKNLAEALRGADKQFGATTPVQLMSLETADGHIPEERARAMGASFLGCCFY